MVNQSVGQSVGQSVSQSVSQSVQSPSSSRASSVKRRRCIHRITVAKTENQGSQSKSTASKKSGNKAKCQVSVLGPRKIYRGRLQTGEQQKQGHCTHQEAGSKQKQRADFMVNINDKEQNQKERRISPRRSVSQPVSQSVNRRCVCVCVHVCLVLFVCLFVVVVVVFFACVCVCA